MQLAELQGQLERKEAYIDKLELRVDELTKDRDQRAELSARLFSENEQLKKQLNDKQLEIDHCHAVCGELRQKLDAAHAQAFGAGCKDQIVAAATTLRIQELERQLATSEADVLEREAALILAAPSDEAKENGTRWTADQITVARMVGTTMKVRAALVRGKAGA